MGFCYIWFNIVRFCTSNMKFGIWDSVSETCNSLWNIVTFRDYSATRNFYSSWAITKMLRGPPMGHRVRDFLSTMALSLFFITPCFWKNIMSLFLKTTLPFNYFQRKVSLARHKFINNSWLASCSLPNCLTRKVGVLVQLWASG